MWNLFLKSSEGYSSMSVDKVSLFPYFRFNKNSFISSSVNRIDLFVHLNLSCIFLIGNSLLEFSFIISLIGLNTLSG